MGMKQWNVRVFRDGHTVHIGQVGETTEALARCAALSRYGVSDEDLEMGGIRSRGEAIYPDEEFDVVPAG